MVSWVHALCVSIFGSCRPHRYEYVEVDEAMVAKFDVSDAGGWRLQEGPMTKKVSRFPVNTVAQTNTLSNFTRSTTRLSA